ncbi:hypothetical protein BVC80_8621g10 [Macleaya cordata]|uniref:Uncharacterized protein n=1 Tax=Macleaya cordata TaxID=56857 RepID=A0A200PYD8_MACCD|nr:hypothetical protein BVC80_8621g10 [Macleaya cordata]
MSSRPVHHRRIFECYWIPHRENQIKICCGVCSKGNPGFSGAAIILGMEWDFDQGWSNVWIASDSMAAIRCFTANKIH